MPVFLGVMLFGENCFGSLYDAGMWLFVVCSCLGKWMQAAIPEDPGGSSRVPSCCELQACCHCNSRATLALRDKHAHERSYTAGAAFCGLSQKPCIKHVALSGFRHMAFAANGHGVEGCSQGSAKMHADQYEQSTIVLLMKPQMSI